MSVNLAENKSLSKVTCCVKSFLSSETPCQLICRDSKAFLGQYESNGWSFLDKRNFSHTSLKNKNELSNPLESSSVRLLF